MHGTKSTGSRTITPIGAGWLFKEPVNRLLQLADLGVAVFGFLGEDKVTIHFDFELSAGAGDESETIGEVGIGVEEFLRRPRGACCVVSGHAVGDRDVECAVGHAAPPCGIYRNKAGMAA